MHLGCVDRIIEKKRVITCLYISCTVKYILPKINNYSWYHEKGKERSDITEHTYSHDKPYTVSFIYVPNCIWTACCKYGYRVTEDR